MLTDIHPKLQMRNKTLTKAFYLNKLSFSLFGEHDFEGYLMIQNDHIQIHFFEHTSLIPEENYGQIYIRSTNIQEIYTSYLNSGVEIHPNGSLEIKPWGQIEFSILDPDNNLITFGQGITN